MNPSPDIARAGNPTEERLLTVVTTCRSRDLPVLKITVRRLQRHVPCRNIVVISPDVECRKISKALGTAVNVLPENSFLPNCRIEDVRKLPISGFPKGAGWYFQQFLKLQYSFVETADDFYLIWDADTVPLRPMRFFNASGRMLLTKAREYHAPYFETYERLLAEDARREFSFIAQQMVIQKSVAREMIRTIEHQISGNETWPWKILKELPPTGNNLFSEYETYGHFIKNRYPDRIEFVERSWFRQEATVAGCKVPTEEELNELAKDFDYVAFERASRGLRRMAKLIQSRLIKYGKRLKKPFAGLL